MGDSEERFPVLKVMQLNDGGRDPRKPGPFPLMHCRLVSVDGLAFDEEPEEPVIGFLEEGRLSAYAALAHDLKPVRLVVDKEQLKLLKLGEARGEVEMLTLDVRLQHIARNNAAALETAFHEVFLVENPFYRGAPGATRPTTGEAPGRADEEGEPPASERANESENMERAGREPPAARHSRVEIGVAVGDDVHWQEVGSLASPILVNVPVLRSWDDQDLPLLRLRAVAQRAGPDREASVSFSIRFASRLQRDATGMILRQESCPPLIHSYAEPGDQASTAELWWQWTIEAGNGKEYVLYLTSREDMLRSLPFNPAAPFTGRSRTLENLEVTLQFGGARPVHCLTMRPVRASDNIKAVSKDELGDFATVSLSRSGKIEVVDLLSTKQDGLEFVLDGDMHVAAETKIIVRSLTANPSQDSLLSIAFHDPQGGEPRVGFAVDEHHHSVKLLDRAFMLDKPGDVAIEGNLLLTGMRRSTLVPIRVILRPPEPLTVLAIDIGASAIAVAIASSRSPAAAAFLLPIGSVIEDEYRDQSVPDGTGPDFIPAWMGVSAIDAPGGRLNPWHVRERHFDPKLRDADAELFERPLLPADILRRLVASAGPHRPGRRIEAHLQPFRHANEGDGLFVIRDLKMEICRKDQLLAADRPSQGSRAIIARRDPDPRWSGWINESDSEALQTEDVLAHAVELILSIYVPDAIAKSGFRAALKEFDAREAWDALADDEGMRNFTLVLTHPASIGKAALDRYRRAARWALVSHFGSDPEREPALHAQVSHRLVPEALAVDAALRNALPIPIETAKDRLRRRLVIDIGSATTDVAVVRNHDRSGGVSVSFALPIAAGSVRRWIASDIRAAASPEMRKELVALGPTDAGHRGLDDQIENAIRNLQDGDSCLQVFLGLGGKPPPRLSIGGEEIGAIKFIPIELDASDLEYVALVPLARSQGRSTLRRADFLFQKGLDRLAHVIVEGAWSQLREEDDVSIDVVLSGRGATFPPIREAIDFAIKSKIQALREIDLLNQTASVFYASDLLCPNGDSRTRLRKMKTVVAEGATLRAMAIETGVVGELRRPPRRSYAVVVGQADFEVDPPAFTSISDVYPLAADRVIDRNGARFWLARMLPDLIGDTDLTGNPNLIADILGPLRPGTAAAAQDSPEGIAVDIARACIVPVREIGRAGNAIRWSSSADLLTVVTDATMTENIRLSDDGSYA